MCVLLHIDRYLSGGAKKKKIQEEKEEDKQKNPDHA